MVRVVTTVGRLLQAVAAFAVLAAFTAGVPWLLTASAGWPLSWIGWPHPAQIPGLAEVTDALTSPWSDQMILALLASLGWMLWLIFVRHVIVEVIAASVDAAAARRGQLRAPVSGRGPIRWVAAVLVGAVIGAVLFDAARAVTSAGTTNPAAAAADAAARRPAVAVTVAAPAIAPVAHTGPRPAITVHSDAATARPMLVATVSYDSDVPGWARDAPGGTHRVQAGDNLWDLAEDKLGDPHRWREIYTLNRGHVQANGYALTDPDEIHIGWTLALPASHSKTAPAPAHRHPPTASSQPLPENPKSPSPGAPSIPTPATPPPSTIAVPGTPAPTTASPAPSSAPASQAPSTAVDAPATDRRADDGHGITLPSQSWISLGLAATIAALAQLLRLHRRRFARLSSPITVRTGPTAPPVPPELTPADAAGRSVLDPILDRELSEEGGDRPLQLAVPDILAPIGIDATGAEIGLFDLPGPGLALTGDGSDAAARAVLGSALATGKLDEPPMRPVVVTTVSLLDRLLPDGVEPMGLDPCSITFDGERLLVLADTGNAVTHAEEEMIARRRLLDTMGEDSMTALNARPDHAEMQPPYVVLLDAADRYAGRLAASAAHQTALHLYIVALGEVDGLAAMTVTPDGAITDCTIDTLTGGRLSTLAAPDLAHLLTMVSDAAARPEPGTDIDAPVEPVTDTDSHDEQHAAAIEPVPDLPAATEGTAPVARVSVLGPVTVTTEAGPVTKGLRSGSYAVLAVLAAYPHGRTLDEMAADVYPSIDPAAAINRVRSDITTIRREVRAAAGSREPMFILYNSGTTRYRIDPDSFEVDLWLMLAAIGRANTATDDAQALAALREAADLYVGDFAEGLGQAWVTDYATTPRLQIISVYARIAELIETDQPDAAIAALEQALRHDPVNEELYQRIMRIQGRLHRIDGVRRTMRQLESQLFDLGAAEPSEATRRVAARQLRQTSTGARP